MLLCKQINCVWYLVYLCSGQRQRLTARNDHVQHHFFRLRPLRHPTQPPACGCRPLAIGLCRDNDPKWRYPPLLRLIHRTGGSAPDLDKPLSSQWLPRFGSHFFAHSAVRTSCIELRPWVAPLACDQKCAQQNRRALNRMSRGSQTRLQIRPCTLEYNIPELCISSA